MLIINMAKVKAKVRRGPKIRIATYVPVICAIAWAGYSERHARELLSEGQLHLPGWLWLRACEFLAERDPSDEAVRRFTDEICDSIDALRRPVNEGAAIEEIAFNDEVDELEID